MVTDKVRNNIEKDLNDLNTNERIEILFYLINSAYDLRVIGNNIKIEYYKRSELIKERSILDYEHRTKENRKREIEKMEKFVTANNKIKLLTERIEKLDKNPEEILKIYKETNVQKLKKDLFIEKEGYISVNKFNRF